MGTNTSSTPHFGLSSSLSSAERRKSVNRKKGIRQTKERAKLLHHHEPAIVLFVVLFHFFLFAVGFVFKWMETFLRWGLPHHLDGPNMFWLRRDEAARAQPLPNKPQDDKKKHPEQVSGRSLSCVKCCVVDDPKAPFALFFFFPSHFCFWRNNSSQPSENFFTENNRVGMFTTGPFNEATLWLFNFHHSLLLYCLAL